MTKLFFGFINIILLLLLSSNAYSFDIPLTVSHCLVSSGYDRGMTQLTKDKKKLVNACIKNWDPSNHTESSQIKCEQDYEDAVSRYVMMKTKATSLSSELDLPNAKFIYSFNPNPPRPNDYHPIGIQVLSPTTSLIFKNYSSGGMSTNPIYTKCDQNDYLKSNEISRQYNWYGAACFYSPGESTDYEIISIDDDYSPSVFLAVHDFPNGSRKATIILYNFGSNRGLLGQQYECSLEPN